MPPPPDPDIQTFGDYPPTLRTYALAVFTSCASISLVVFLFGLFVVYKKRLVWKNGVFRSLLAIQFINFIRFIMRILLTDVAMHNEAGCRIVLALSNMSSHLIVYLCAYMVVYLELVIIHNLSPQKRWPRVALLTICIVCSVCPELVYLFIPRSKAGLDSFCNLPFLFNDKLFHVVIGTIVVWALLAGIVSLVAMTIVATYILRTSKKVAHIVNIATDGIAPYQYSGNKPKRSTADLLNRTLKTTVWFPVTPVASLWFNSALIFVRYYTQQPYYNLEYVNVALLSLTTVFMAVAFFMNPVVMAFLRDYRKSWSLTKREHSLASSQRDSSGLSLRASSLFPSNTLS